jgi:hypothetical protein
LIYINGVFKMSENIAMVVLTSKNLQTMFAEGGCAYWRAKKDSILACQYVVATRNRNSTWVQGPEQHGSAFFIGEINGVKEVDGRYVVQVSRYATINIPNFWPGTGANPVRYIPLSDLLTIDFESIEWKLWTTNTNEGEATPSMTIDKAKAALAATFGVKPEQIEITIKG